MIDNTTDSVQNRFTAYLVTAVTNQRGRYIAKCNKQQEAEYFNVYLLEKNYIGFEAQFQTYINEEALGSYEDWDRKILFGRVFGERTYAELGEQFDMELKQVEMAYFYVIRKIRKNMEDKKNEI